MALVSECIPDFDFGKHMFLNICFVLVVLLSRPSAGKILFGYIGVRYLVIAL